jgi:chemotaxis protein methyltransferase CheR/two-component system CheB/CheR fusion protein
MELKVLSAISVAGIGASAGGLEAMLPMCARLRPTGRVAYVIAQHMANDGHSELVARLIQRESALPVVLVDKTVRVQADTIYMIPAGRDGLVRSDTLTLSEPGVGNISTPSVNTLFKSIAENCGSNAIGIVLSGTGSDGVAGCRAIRAAGGLILAQLPTEAKYDGMPVAVIEAGLADQVVSSEDIDHILAARFPCFVAPVAAVKTTSIVSGVESGEADTSTAERRELEQLQRQVLEATGIDFSSYKEETLLRRLEKRKEAMGVATADAYQALIRRDPHELHSLQHLFLVSMSSFFRDRTSFQSLERALAARIVNKKEGVPVRVWVPGCASGEEPYTLAIILSELLGNCRQLHPIFITATDLNVEALEMARTGIYPLTAFQEMDAALRDRYFIGTGQQFEVSPELKACVHFEQRDVLGGARPDELDLVSCRNLLIYMKSHLQDQLIKTFHQALLPSGLLFLGQYESLSFLGSSLFTPVDHYHRLFARRQ